MNARIRAGFVALSLTVGAVHVADAAAYSTQQQPGVTQPAPEGTTNAPVGRTYAAQHAVTPGANDRAGSGAIRKPGLPSTYGSGNDFNFMNGGGG
jgi:hypothetical protein